MPSAEIIATPTTFSRSEGIVRGQIVLRIGSADYPAANWHDFPVAVLVAWCGELSTLLKGDADLISMHFMDGPFVAHLRRKSASEGQLRFEWRHEAGASALLDVGVELEALARSVVHAADLTLRECMRQGWWSRDEETLQTAAANLQAALSQTGPGSI